GGFPDQAQVGAGGRHVGHVRGQGLSRKRLRSYQVERGVISCRPELWPPQPDLPLVDLQWLALAGQQAPRAQAGQLAQPLLSSGLELSIAFVAGRETSSPAELLEAAHLGQPALPL